MSTNLIESGIRVKNPDIFSNDESVFYNAFWFIKYIQTFSSIDIMCFTFHTAYINRMVRINRLICNHIIGDLPSDIQKVTRVVSNCHSKLYILYIAGKIVEIYIGSWNFASPSYLELIVKAPRKEHKNLIKYYDEIYSLKRSI